MRMTLGEDGRGRFLRGDDLGVASRGGWETRGGGGRWGDVGRGNRGGVGRGNRGDVGRERRGWGCGDRRFWGCLVGERSLGDGKMRVGRGDLGWRGVGWGDLGGVGVGDRVVGLGVLKMERHRNRSLRGVCGGGRGR